MQWSDEKPADVIDLHVYAGADGTFTLYEDENVNYNYEKGLYSMITFSYDNDSHQLSVSERKGEYPGMLKSRKFNVILVSENGRSNAGTIEYNGEALSLKLR